MENSRKRILFLCAHRSVRELMAASILNAQTPTRWDIWIAPGSFVLSEVALVRQVLEEVQIALFSPPTAEPSFDRSWDEGIVLCSGAADQ
jgi:hypothetical protein